MLQRRLRVELAVGVAVDGLTVGFRVYRVEVIRLGVGLGRVLSE